MTADPCLLAADRRAPWADRWCKWSASLPAVAEVFLQAKQTLAVTPRLPDITLDDFDCAAKGISEGTGLGLHQIGPGVLAALPSTAKQQLIAYLVQCEERGTWS